MCIDASVRIEEEHRAARIENERATRVEEQRAAGELLMQRADALEKRIRSLFPGVLVACACFGLAITEYPWHPGRLVSTAAAGFLLIASTVGIGVYFTLERQSAANPEFFKGAAPLQARDVLAVLAWGAVPLWLALNANFPELTYFILQWLKWQFKLSPHA